MAGYEVLTFREKVGYGLGDAASNFFFQFFNIFLLFYYTDVFGISAMAVGTMFLVTKVVDAVSDPVMGLIADRTNSRWGRFRPYLLWGAIPYGVCGYMMFAGTSFDLTETQKLIYAYVTFTLMMLCYTLVNVPYGALMGVISPSSEERTKVSNYRFFFGMSAGWLISTFVTPLNSILGDGDNATGFKLTMIIFAVISVVMFWVAFYHTRERVITQQTKPNVFKDLKAVSKNTPWVIMFIVGIFMLAMGAIHHGASIYYVKYFVGDDGSPIFLIFDRSALFLSSGFLAMILGVLVTRFLVIRFEKRDLMIFLIGLHAILLGILFFLPSDNFGLLVTLNILAKFAFGPTPVLIWSMYADCADYGEWQSGRRTTGLIFSGIQFAHKLGLAIGAGFTGILLGWFGFVANEVQTEASLYGIRIAFGALPAALGILCCIIMYFYRIDAARIKEVEGALQLRRQPA